MNTPKDTVDESELRLWQNRLMNQMRDNLALASKMLYISYTQKKIINKQP